MAVVAVVVVVVVVVGDVGVGVGVGVVVVVVIEADSCKGDEEAGRDIGDGAEASEAFGSSVTKPLDLLALLARCRFTL